MTPSVTSTIAEPLESVGATATTPQPVSCGELPREPTDLEVSLLVEPGPFSENFSEDGATAAAIARNPGTHDERVDAIIRQVQGEYAQAVCDAIRFSVDIGDAKERPGASQVSEVVPQGQQHFALVVDASGSMAARTGSGTRMDAAHTAVAHFVARLPPESTVSLRVYGQEGGNSDEDKAVSCASSQVVFEGEGGDASFAEALARVQPVGWTPLARAISLVPQDIPGGATSAVVYVVTDGKETCGGDPVEVTKRLASEGIRPIINVVGFEADDADQAALLSIADAGNGNYIKASSVSELNAFWDEEYERLDQAWQDWRKQELSRLTAQKEQLYLEVEQIVAAMISTADVDLPRAQAMIRSLEEQDHLEGDERRGIDSAVTWYFSDIHTYARGFEMATNNAIYSDSVGAMFDVSNETYGAWREAYQQRMKRDE